MSLYTKECREKNLEKLRWRYVDETGSCTLSNAFSLTIQQTKAHYRQVTALWPHLSDVSELTAVEHLSSELPCLNKK